MKFCEFCGSMGAYSQDVEGLDYQGEFDLCDECGELWDCHTLPGKTRKELLEKVLETTLSLNGPKSGTDNRYRGDWDLLTVCMGCHRKISSNLVFGDMVALPKDLRKHLPKGLKRAHTPSFCDDCVNRMILSMVESWPMTDLPLHLAYKEFVGNDGEPWDYLNDRVDQLVRKKLKGEPLSVSPTISKPVELKCLDISIHAITERDFHLFSQDGEIEIVPDEEKGKVTTTNANPFVVAPYEHGFFLCFDPHLREYELETFGYSINLRNIVKKAQEMGYSHVRIDSSGPLYKEFNK